MRHRNSKSFLVFGFSPFKSSLLLTLKVLMSHLREPGQKDEMNIYELQSWMNCIIPLIASIGYVIRIAGHVKSKDYPPHFIMLVLFYVASSGMAVIYFLNVSGFWRILEPDFEIYSRLFIRPYFTFMGSLLLLASWIHPEVIPILKQIRSYLWTKILKRQ